MRVVFSPTHARYHPRFYFKAGERHEHPEVPARAEAIHAALDAAGHDFITPEDYGSNSRGFVHTDKYLAFLEGAHARWRALGIEAPEAVPNIHPGRHMRTVPGGIVGQVGYYVTDMSSPIGPETWPAACESANVAFHAMMQVRDGADAAYALCRPPGHHAYADVAGGFCFLNNIAIAASHAVANLRRVAILDIDVHHGNGTQGIFWARPDVLTLSLHCDPTDFYPFFSGYDHERGAGAGRHCNVNFPLPPGTDDESYLVALEEALSLIRDYAPEMLFVALGVDGYEGDPFAGFRLTTAGFGRIAGAIGGLGLPTVLVQEGGYNLDDLGANVAEFIAGFEAAR